MAIVVLLTSVSVLLGLLMLTVFRNLKEGDRIMSLVHRLEDHQFATDDDVHTETIADNDSTVAPEPNHCPVCGTDHVTGQATRNETNYYGGCA